MPDTNTEQSSNSNINSNIIKHTPNNHESLSEGAIQNILTQKAGKKASTLATTPVFYQLELEQITLPSHGKVQ